MYVYQDTKLNEDQKEEQRMTEFETEPKLEYRFSDDFGSFMKVYWRDRLQEMPDNWNADRTERELSVKPGIWANFDEWKTSLWAEFGTWELTTPSETLKAYDYWRIAGTAEYQILDNLAFTSELGYQQNYNPYGPWDNTSSAYVPFVKLGIRYNF